MTGNAQSSSGNAQSSSGNAQSPGVSQSDEAAAAGLPKIIPFSSLARCGDEVWIETGGQVYRLRKTRQGKLILTK